MTLKCESSSNINLGKEKENLKFDYDKKNKELIVKELEIENLTK